MKQRYQEPLLELMMLANEDVITTSGFPGEPEFLIFEEIERL